MEVRMTVTSQLLSEIESLPAEYEQDVVNFISSLRDRPTFSGKRGVSVEGAYGILRGMGIDSNIERDEGDRI
jgi:hypothetical protein